MHPDQIFATDLGGMRITATSDRHVCIRPVDCLGNDSTVMVNRVEYNMTLHLHLDEKTGGFLLKNYQDLWLSRTDWKDTSPAARKKVGKLIVAPIQEYLRSKRSSLLLAKAAVSATTQEAASAAAEVEKLEGQLHEAKKKLKAARRARTAAESKLDKIECEAPAKSR